MDHRKLCLPLLLAAALLTGCGGGGVSLDLSNDDGTTTNTQSGTGDVNDPFGPWPPKTATHP